MTTCVIVPSEIGLQDSHITRAILDATRLRSARRSLWRDRMLKSKTASQLVTDQQGTQAKRSSMADDIQPDHAPKKRGNLAATLDPLLISEVEDRQPVGHRPTGNTGKTEFDGR